MAGNLTALYLIRLNRLMTRDSTKPNNSPTTEISRVRGIPCMSRGTASKAACQSKLKPDSTWMYSDVQAPCIMQICDAEYGRFCAVCLGDGWGRNNSGEPPKSATAALCLRTR